VLGGGGGGGLGGGGGGRGGGGLWGGGVPTSIDTLSVVFELYFEGYVVAVVYQPILVFCALSYPKPLSFS